MSKKIVNVGDFVEVLDSSFVEHGVKRVTSSTLLATVL